MTDEKKTWEWCNTCYFKFIISTIQNVIFYGYLANLKKHRITRDATTFQITVYLCEFNYWIQAKQKIIKLKIKILLQRKHNKILTTHRSKHFCCIKINSEIKLAHRFKINRTCTAGIAKQILWQNLTLYHDGKIPKDDFVTNTNVIPHIANNKVWGNNNCRHKKQLNDRWKKTWEWCNACYFKFIISILQNVICYEYLANLKKHRIASDAATFQITVYLCEFTCWIQAQQKIIKLKIKMLLQRKHNKILTTHRSKHFCCIKINSQIKLARRCKINRTCTAGIAKQIVWQILTLYHDGKIPEDDFVTNTNVIPHIANNNGMGNHC
jgi:hypothetical protein